MDKIKAFWAWWNGRKSAVGGYLLGAAALMGYIEARYGVQIPHREIIEKILTDAGGILTGVGILHKAAKAISPK